jgi:hypothetical protein
MNNILFLDGEWSENAEIFPYSQITGAPASNLLLPEKTYAYNSGPMTWTGYSTAFDLHGDDSGYNAIFLGYWRVTPEATFRIRGANSQDDLISAPVWEMIDTNFYRQGGIDESFRYINTWLILSTRRFNPWLRINVHDPFNPINEIHGGVIRVGKIWRPEHNVSYGYERGYEDPSIQHRGVGGGLSIHKLPGWGKQILPFNFSSENDANNFHTRYIKYGKHHPLWIHIDSDNPMGYLSQIYGSVSQGLISRPSFNVHRVSLEVQEM